MQKSIGFATALLLGVLAALAPNVGAAQRAGGAKKSSVHKPAGSSKKPDNVKHSDTGKPAGAAKNAGGDEVTRLDGIQRHLINEMQRIGGGITPSESISHVENNKDRLLGRIDRVERAEKRAGMTSKELEAQRKKFENQSVFGSNSHDLPDRAMGEVVKRALSESAGKAYGVLSAAENIAEYGARYKIKQDNIAATDDLLKQQHANSEALSRMDAKLHKDLSDAYDRLKALNEMQALYEKITLKLAKARAPVSLRYGIYRTRVKDTAGDEEEIRKEKKYAKEHMRIGPSDGERSAKRLRPGIHLSTRKYGGISKRSHSRRNEDRVEAVPNGGNATAETALANLNPADAFVAGLFFPPLPDEIARQQLLKAAADNSRARAALRQGVGPEFVAMRDDLEHLADPTQTRSPKVRRFARFYLSQLPDHFVPGFVFERDDGTMMQDPDPIMRLLLSHEEDSVRNAEGDSGGGDD